MKEWIKWVLIIYIYKTVKKTIIIEFFNQIYYKNIFFFLVSIITK